MSKFCQCGQVQIDKGRAISYNRLFYMVSMSSLTLLTVVCKVYSNFM